MSLNRLTQPQLKPSLRWTVLLLLFLTAASLPGQSGSSKVFGGAQIDEIYRIRLDRGDLLLESILAAIQEHNIQDGALLTAVGSLQECTFHGVTSFAAEPEQEFTTLKEPMEILNINGIIAAGEPHFHMTLSNTKGAFGGHLEKGCRVLYRAELTIAKFSGTALARTPNEAGVPMLQPK